MMPTSSAAEDVLVAGTPLATPDIGTLRGFADAKL